MHYRTWFWSTLALIIVAGGCRHPARVSGPTMGMEPSDAMIVTGLGEAKGPPDVVTLSVGVQRRGPDVKQAIADANQTLRAVLAALTASGVAASDLRTSQINVGLEEPPPGPYPQPAWPYAPAVEAAPVEPPPPAKGTPARAKAGNAPARPGAQAEPGPAVEPTPPASPAAAVPRTYNVSLTVTAKLRQIDRAGEALAAAFMAGANQAYGLQLGWEDPTPWLDKARRSAMKDARHRVDELAELSHVKVTRVLSVVEQNCGSVIGPQWSPYGMPPAPMMAERMSSVPFEPGEVQASCAVRVAFAIEK